MDLSVVFWSDISLLINSWNHWFNQNWPKGKSKKYWIEFSHGHRSVARLLIKAIQSGILWHWMPALSYPSCLLDCSSYTEKIERKNFLWIFQHPIWIYEQQRQWFPKYTEHGICFCPGRSNTNNKTIILRPLWCLPAHLPRLFSASYKNLINAIKVVRSMFFLETWVNKKKTFAW